MIHLYGQVQIQPSFWQSWTAQGVGIILSIVTFGGAVVRLLYKLEMNARITLWEHKVMWAHHTAHHEIPAYPNIIIERRRHDSHPQHDRRKHYEQNQG